MQSIYIRVNKKSIVRLAQETTQVCTLVEGMETLPEELTVPSFFEGNNSPYDGKIWHEKIGNIPSGA